MEPVQLIAVTAWALVVAVGCIFTGWGVWIIAEALEKYLELVAEGATNGPGTDPERLVGLEAEIKGLRTRMADTEELVEARYRKLLARDRRARKAEEEEAQEFDEAEEAALALEAAQAVVDRPEAHTTGNRRLRRPRRGRRPF